MKKILILISAIVLVGACKSNQYADLGDGIFADIRTNKGDMIVQLYPEQTPVTVANFVSLAEGTNPFVDESFKEKKFYNGLIFHRVMKDFMIQGGDPEGTGRGNPGYRFKDEFVDTLKHDTIGVLSMANGGKNTNGSQFFITHGPAPWLDGVHSVFGKLVQGYDILDSIANVPVEQGSNRPLSTVTMNEVEIIRNGKEARQYDPVQVMDKYFKEVEKEEEERKKKIAEFAALVADQKSKAETTPTGLQVLTLNEGEGIKPNIGEYAFVNYAVWLEDGTLIDTSSPAIAEEYGKLEELTRMHRGNLAPARMQISPDASLIAGFKEALLEMQVGDKVRLFVPPHLAYGAQGNGPVPPNANLVFELEMLEIAE